MKKTIHTDRLWDVCGRRQDGCNAGNGPNFRAPGRTYGTRLIFAFAVLTVIGVARGQTPSVTAESAPPAVASTPAADPVAPPSTLPKRTAAELEKLAEPIALHPDPLIAVILPASVYPVEIVQAARFVKDTNNISKIDDQPWDDNVKAVAEFPQVIQMMNADLDWTIDLGNAFLEQPKELMDAIQALRAKAHDAGTLQTTPQQIVTVTNQTIFVTNSTQVVTETREVVYVQPANPQVVYVPTYTSAVYYPPPAYVYNPYAPLITFGVGMAWGAILANNCDWHGGGVWHGGGDVNINRNVNINGGNYSGGNYNGGNYNGGNNNGGNNNGGNNNGGNNGNRPGNGGGNNGGNGANGGNRPGNGGNGPGGARPSQQPAQKWQPDQNRMRNNAGGSASTREARGWGSANRPSTGDVASRPSTGAGGARPSTGNVGSRPSTGNAGNRPSTGNVASRPSTGNTGNRPSTGNTGNRPSTGNTGNRPSTGNASSRPSTGNSGGRASTGSSGRDRSASSSSGGGAFSGVSNGSSARRDSSRGSSSRGGGSRGGGGRGGRGR